MITKRTRLPPEKRIKQLLEVACDIACTEGYSTLTLMKVAKAAGVVHPLVLHHFKTVEGMRTRLMRYAVDNQIMPIIAQGLAHRDPIALSASEDLKRTALKTLKG